MNKAYLLCGVLLFRVEPDNQPNKMFQFYQANVHVLKMQISKMLVYLTMNTKTYT